MFIQYCHIRKFNEVVVKHPDLIGILELDELSAKGGKTIAMESIPLWFAKDLKTGDFFTKSVGKARCSDEENYNKKTGRELSQSRMKPMVFTVMVNEGVPDNGHLVLRDKAGCIYIFEKKPGSQYLHFIEYDHE
jgi:hypothetical protein